MDSTGRKKIPQPPVEPPPTTGVSCPLGKAPHLKIALGPGNGTLSGERNGDLWAPNLSTAHPPTANADEGITIVCIRSGRIRD